MMRFQEKIQKLFLLFFSIAVTLNLVGCGVFEKGHPAYDEVAFQIAILDDNAYNVWMRYTKEESWSVLQKAFPAKTAYEFTAKDIETYRWSDQTIMLTSDATKAFFDDLGCTGDQSDCYGRIFRGFVVAYEDYPVFGGVILDKETVYQMAVGYPVMYLSLINGQLEITLNPYLAFPSERTFTDDEWQVIKDDRIKAFFQKLRKYEK